jgi:hypothetical protein
VWLSVVAGFVLYALVAHGREFAAYPWAVDGELLAAAVGLSLLRRLAGAVRWVTVVGLGIPAGERGRRRDQLRVYFLSNLASYVPGGVFYVASRLEMCRLHGVSTLRAGSALLYETMLLVWTGAWIGLPAIVPSMRTVPGFLLTAVASALPFLPVVARWCVHRLQRWRGHETMPFPMRSAEAGVLWFTSLAVWGLGGASLFLTLRAVVPGLPWTMLDQVVAAGAAGWTGGFLAIWAPAGLGVREGLLTAMLPAQVAGPPLAAALVASRLMTVAEDVFWALATLAMGRKGRAGDG